MDALVNLAIRNDRMAKRISAAQIRAARALTGMRRDTLADMAELHDQTIKRLEDDQSHDACRQSNHEAVKTALENYGVIFISAEDGKGEGVRLAW